VTILDLSGLAASAGRSMPA